MNIKSIGSKIKGNPKMVEGTVYSMLIICSISHFLNDMIQSIIPSIYPIVKDKFDFSFAQIGIITLVFQMTCNLLRGFMLTSIPVPMLFPSACASPWWACSCWLLPRIIF